MSHAHLVFHVDGYEDDAATLTESVNEIHGKALASYFVSALRAGGHETVDPWCEDHGWDFETDIDGATYLVACCVLLDAGDDADARNEAHITWSRQRSLTDSLFGRNKLTADDVSVGIFRGIAEKIARPGTLEFDLT